MPSLEEWFNIVAKCLDAMFFEAPVTMNIAKRAGDRAMLCGLSSIATSRLDFAMDTIDFAACAAWG